MIRSDRSGVAVEGLCEAFGLGVAPRVACRRWPIRSARELRPVGESCACGVSERTRSVAGVWADSVDGVGAPDCWDDPILELYCRARGLSVATPADDRVELSLGEGVTLLEGLVGAGVALVDGWLDRDWISRRREAIRSAMDCPPVELRSGAPAEEFERNEADGRLGLTDGLDRSTDGLGRLNDGLGRLGLTELLGRLGLTDGADRCTDGLGRLGLTDGLGRLGLTDRFGDTA